MRSNGLRKDHVRFRIAAAALSATLLGALAASPALASDQCPNEANLVANCGFEGTGGGSAAGWELVAGTGILDPTSALAHSGSFSANIDSEPQEDFSYLATASTCVEGIVPGEIYLFGAWRYLNNGGPSLTCTVAIQEREASGSPCGGVNISTHEIPPDGGPNGAWEDLVSKFVASTDPAADDALLTVSCHMPADPKNFGLNFDDVYLIPIDAIFHDGFEQWEEICAWSTHQGGDCPLA